MYDTMLQGMKFKYLDHELPFPSLEMIFDELIKANTDTPSDTICHNLTNTIFETLMKKTTEEIINKSVEKRIFLSFYNDIFTGYMFRKSYQKVYRLSPQLINLLADTELKSVPADYVNLPFPCIYLSIPSEVKLLDPEKNEIEGIYVILNDRKDNSIISKYDSEFVEYAKNPLNDFRSLFLFIVLRGMPYNYYWHLYIKPGQDVLEVANTFLEKFFVPSRLQEKAYEMNIAPEKILTMTIPQNTEDDERTFFKEIFFLTMNAVMYITSKNQEFPLVKGDAKDTSKVKNKKKIRKVLKRSGISYYKVGYDIVIDKAYQQFIDLRDADRQHRHKITTQFVVSGHWRMQAYGKQWSEHRKIWIMPFLKGKEFADFVSHNYKVQ